MDYHHFIDQVQARAHLASSDEALKATRATLETLGERLQGGEPGDLASQLPSEIKSFLGEEGKGENFGLEEFLDRVTRREGIEKPAARSHARAVLSVVQEAVSEGELEDVRGQLPREYDPLFDSGDEGER